MKNKYIVHCLFTGLVLASASPALFAQQSNAPAQNNPPSHRIQPFPGANRPQPPSSRNEDILTKDQIASLRAVGEAQRDKILDLEAKFHEAQKALFETRLNGKFDEAVTRQKAQAAASLQIEIEVLEAKAFSQINPPLSPDQLEKFRARLTSPPRPGQSVPGQSGAPAATNHIATMTNSPAKK
jgi:Spy/CpxP family protein refolding chaperone